MRDEGAFVFCAVLGAVIVAVLSSRQHKQEMARIAAVRVALDHRDLDEALRRELMQILVAGHRGGLLRAATRLLLQPATWYHAWCGLAWLMFVGCCSLLVLGEMGAAPNLNNDSVVGMAVAGFAMLSMPLAVRELSNRRAPVPAAPRPRS